MTQLTFKNAVDNTPELTNAYQTGLHAIKESDKYIVCNDTRRLKGSVNLDDSLRNSYPKDPRWDYGIGWQMKNNSECAIWIEIHSADSNHVKEVIEKVKWLKNWLHKNAVDLKNMTRPENGYVWIATNGVSLTRTSNHARQLAKAGLSFPQKILKLKEE